MAARPEQTGTTVAGQTGTTFAEPERSVRLDEAPAVAGTVAVAAAAAAVEVEAPSPVAPPAVQAVEVATPEAVAGVPVAEVSTAAVSAPAVSAPAVSAPALAPVAPAPRPIQQSQVDDNRPTCTVAQLRRFIKSRPWIPMHELRRRFGINGADDDVNPIRVGGHTLFVGLPYQESRLMAELLAGGDVGYELSLDPITPVVVGVYPMRPVPRG